jgi:DNA polymerase-4
MVCFLTGSQQIKENALNLAAKIKREINNQYKYIRCSIGIVPKTFLVKPHQTYKNPMAAW